jgi:hypothetical protein
MCVIDQLFLLFKSQGTSPLTVLVTNGGTLFPPPVANRTNNRSFTDKIEKKLEKKKRKKKSISKLPIAFESRRRRAVAKLFLLGHHLGGFHVLRRKASTDVQKQMSLAVFFKFE